MNKIDRREMLRLAGLGATLAALPRVATAGPGLPPARTLTNATRYRIGVGDFEATVFVTGFMDGTPAQPFVAPEATAQEFGEAFAAASSNGHFRLPFPVLLLQRGRDNILIDTGPGGKAAPEFDLSAHLAQAGLAPGDITAVLLTHAHFDHLGGLLDEHDRPVFTAAEYFCTAEEIDFWMAPKPDLSRMLFKPAPFIASARRVFEHVPFTRIKPDTKLPDGLTPVLAPGHTPGHMTVRIESRDETLHHIADLTHYARLMLPHPEWTIGSDVDPRQAAASRRSLCARLAADRTRVFGSHLPFPGLGALHVRGAGFEWVPEDWV